MPKKPPSWDQPTLFPLQFDNSHEPKNDVTSPVKGDDDAVHDHSSRTPATTDGVARATAADAPAPADDRSLRQGTEGQPRRVEGNALTGTPRQPSDPDRQRSAGDGSQGAGGSFAERIERERSRSTLPRRSDGIPSQSHVARLKASQRTLFDSFSGGNSSA